MSCTGPADTVWIQDQSFHLLILSVLVFVSINFQLDIQGLLKNFMIICFVVQKSIPDILIYFGLLTFK